MLFCNIRHVIFQSNVTCDKLQMTKEQAFEDVSKIIFDRACQLIVGGNPAYESEQVLFHIEMVMTEWAIVLQKLLSTAIH